MVWYPHANKLLHHIGKWSRTPCSVLLKQKNSRKHSFLKNDDYGSCHVEIAGESVNLGLSKGMQVPCKLLSTKSEDIFYRIAERNTENCMTYYNTVNKFSTVILTII